jgi:hypothetical protein
MTIVARKIYIRASGLETSMGVEHTLLIDKVESEEGKNPKGHKDIAFYCLNFTNTVSLYRRLVQLCGGIFDVKDIRETVIEEILQVNSFLSGVFLKESKCVDMWD